MNQSFNSHKNLLHNGHLTIINFFKLFGFDTNIPGVLTNLSILDPSDRCVILEELFNPSIHDIILTDKLLLAYITNNRFDLANKVIEYCINAGESDINIFGLKDKLNTAIDMVNQGKQLVPSRTKDQRLELYNEKLSATNNPVAKTFLNILINFCNNYY